MTASVEQKILAKLDVIIAGQAAKNLDWIPIESMMLLTGLDKKTIHNYAYEEKIVKKGRLYSYRSYLQFCGIYKKRGRKCQ